MVSGLINSPIDVAYVDPIGLFLLLDYHQATREVGPTNLPQKLSKNTQAVLV